MALLIGMYVALIQISELLDATNNLINLYNLCTKGQECRRMLKASSWYLLRIKVDKIGRYFDNYRIEEQ